MGRKKGSLNKKNDNVEIKENIEVSMTEGTTQENVLDSVQTELDLARAELEKVKLEIEEKKQEYKFESKREISPDEQKIVDKQVTKINVNKSLQKKIEKQKEFDNQKVTGRFMNRRSPGQSVKLTYFKYPDDPVKWYIFEDGKIYTIPRGFADQLNDYYNTPIFIQKQGEMDPNKPVSAIHEVDISNKKYAFTPINF